LFDLLVVLLQRLAEARVALTLVIEINGIGWYKWSKRLKNATRRMLHTENSRQNRAGDDGSVSESHSEYVG
jgi:nicotinamide riboside transporter PnuC